MLRRLTTAPTVLVTDSGRGSAISIIRSLGRRGWRVIAADSDPRSLGFRSRFAAGRLVYPAPEQQAEAFLAAIEETMIAQGVDLLIPVTDAALLPLSRSRARFAELGKLALPEADALAAVSDKLRTVELARELGVPVPETHLVTTAEEALAAAPALGWPVVLKPLSSKRVAQDGAISAFQVGYANDEATLAARMNVFAGHCPVLLQKYHAGVGHGVELLAHEGRPLAAFQHERLRELPLHGGPSALRRSVPLDPLLYRHSERLLAALRWTGLAMVEFKLGAEGPMLMEINGRVWGSLPLACASGMDFPGRLADLWLSGPPPAHVPLAAEYRVGVRTRNLELDLMWIVSVLLQRNRYPYLPLPKRREALRAAAQLLHPGYKCDIVRISDPWPGLAELVKIVRKFRSKLGEG